MGFFKSKQNLPKYEGHLFGYRYRVTCAFLEWDFTLDIFTNKEPEVTYKWVRGERNRHTVIVLENSIRRMCEAHGIPTNVKVGEVFPDWSGNPDDEPGIEYQTNGYLLAEFSPTLPDSFFP